MPGLLKCTKIYFAPILPGILQVLIAIDDAPHSRVRRHPPGARCAAPRTPDLVHSLTVGRQGSPVCIWARAENAGHCLQACNPPRERYAAFESAVCQVCTMAKRHRAAAGARHSVTAEVTNCAAKQKQTPASGSTFTPALHVEHQYLCMSCCR
jgi:hypothetical protein